MTNLDVAALAGYCVAYGHWVEAEQQMRKHGILMKSTRGEPDTESVLVHLGAIDGLDAVVPARVRHVSLEPKQGRLRLCGTGRGDRI